MLGCKLIKIHKLVLRHLGINRYMLGCKCKCNILKIIEPLELIDTCWDVNNKGLTVLTERG